MADERTPKLDVQDFIGSVIPGSIMIIGVFPFFPNIGSADAVSIVIPLFLIGFGVGRAVHELARATDEVLKNDTHRELFFDELVNPQLVTQEAVEEMRQLLTSEYHEFGFETISGKDPSLTRPDAKISSEKQVTESEKTRIRDTCYGHVQAYIHINGTGRSRKFKALFSFYRNMWMVSILLGITYVTYGVSIVITSQDDVFGYPTGIESTDANIGLLFLLSLVIFFGTARIFGKAKNVTKIQFVQYLVSDTVVMMHNRMTSERS